jgi:protein TonB
LQICPCQSGAARLGLAACRSFTPTPDRWCLTNCKTIRKEQAMPLLRDSARTAIGSTRWYAVPLSIAVHAVGVGAVLIVPLLVTGVLLPPPEQFMTFVAAAPAPPAPAPPVAAPPAPTALPSDVVFDAAPLAAADAPLDPPPAPLVNLGVTVANTVAPERIGGAARLGPLPAPPVPDRVRVGGAIIPPRKIKDATPTYPAAARAARIGGVVIVEAVIGRDGRIASARVVRSVPLLDAAALDAVREWRYTPTLLNGQPVDVVLTVAVNFAFEP